MDCEGVRKLGIELRIDEVSAADRSAVDAHRAGCASCASDDHDLHATLELLHQALPEIEPAPGGWTRLEARLAPRAPVRSSTRWLPAAAAAGILAAAASFLVLLFLPGSPGTSPVVADTGETLAWEAPYQADRFTTLTLPGTGILKLDAGTRVRFAGPRAVVLESGRLFAEILPSGRGFEVRAPETLARVQGTRFGVAVPATVCVVEGLVQVSTAAGTREVGPRQAIVGDRLTELDEHLVWLVQHERPSLRLRLDPLDRDTVTPGSPLKWHVILETDAVAPLFLGRPRDLSQTLSLLIDDVVVPLDPNSIRLAEASVGASGRVRIDVARRCVLECGVDPALFRVKGPVRVRASYTSGAHAPEGAWVGFVRSDPVTVEVR
jgi:ferric-dicitrate binding protein FerR (iron transport regulator)